MRIACSAALGRLLPRNSVMHGLIVALLAAPLFCAPALAATAPARPAPTAPAARQPVDLELVLATDTSGSIDWNEARLQRQGVATSFRSPEIERAINAGALGRIAVAYMDWSSAPFTRLVIDWRVISDAASAQAFADALLKAPPSRGNGTDMGGALLAAANLIETNALQGTRRTIDISGDGPYNRGYPVSYVRDEIAAQGITINGLPIVSDEYGGGDWGIYYDDITQYYINCVIGGRGSFAIPSKGLQDFAQAMRRKLVLEISEDLPSVQTAANKGLIRVAATPARPNPLLPPSQPRLTQEQANKNCNSADQFYGGFR
jgi:hypothetical protein